MFKKLYKSLTIWIFIGLIAGIVTGLIMGHDAIVLKPLGNIFIKLIKMLVVPLIIFSIITGAASLGKSTNLGKVSAVTFIFIIFTSLLAVSFAMYVGHIFQPGVGLALDKGTHEIAEEALNAKIPQFWPTILSFIPSNILLSMTQNKIIQIIFFCVFFGIGMKVLKKDQEKLLINGLDGILNVLVWMINIVMLTAPIGVFALTASSIGTYGFAKLTSVVNLFVLFMGCVIIYALIIYPILVKLFSDISPFTFINKVKKIQAVAFSTSSSMATLPVTLNVTEKDLGVKSSTASFVIPLGATINMTGIGIYYGLVATFFAQFYNIELGISQYIIIAFTSTLGAIGQAGIPGPSFLIYPVLLAAGIPVEGLPILFALDRIFDMTRTALNITGDVACAVIVDKYNK